MMKDVRTQKRNAVRKYYFMSVTSLSTLMKGLHFLEFNDHFRGKQIVVCAPGQDDCYLIFISRNVLF